jgi:hypothetical protein
VHWRCTLSNDDSLSPKFEDTPSPPKVKSPWDPYPIAALTFLISSIVVCILLALNWRRLGKPKWVLRTILLSVAIVLLVIGVALGWVWLFVQVPDVPIFVVMIVPFLAMGANLGFTFGLAHYQRGGYKKWKSEGPEAAIDHTYDLKVPLAIGVVIPVAICCLGVFMIPLMDMVSGVSIERTNETPFPEITRVGLEEAKTAYDEDTAVFLDVRGEGYYEESHIPGTVYINLVDLEENLYLLDRGDWIIPYCT